MLEKNEIQNAFIKAHENSKIFLSDKYVNKKKSAEFVEEIGNMFLNKLPDYKISRKKIKSKMPKEKSDEWLFDIVVCKEKTIGEIRRKKLHRANYRTNIEWVIESEFATSIKGTMDDFSKLLAAKSKNLLYLNGYANLNSNEFQNYVLTRLKTIEKVLCDIPEPLNLYYCFWPSPNKKGNDSFWNNEISKLLEIIRLFKYDFDEKKFCEINK